MTSTDRPWIIYLRLSDFRGDPDGFGPRADRLSAEVERLGGTVAGEPVIENDSAPMANGKSRPASAFKRRKVTLPGGRTEWRVWRPRFRSVLDDITAGRANLMCEDLDRATRDPRDLEDLLDACAASGGSARSLSGTLTLTDGGAGRRDRHGPDHGDDGEQDQPGHRPPRGCRQGAAGRAVLRRRAQPVRVPARPGRAAVSQDADRRARRGGR